LIYRRFCEAVEAAVLECEVFVVGLSVRVNAETVYEPDVLLRCGARLGDDVVEISDPTVVIEVSSASTQRLPIFRLGGSERRAKGGDRGLPVAKRGVV